MGDITSFNLTDRFTDRLCVGGTDDIQTTSPMKYLIGTNGDTIRIVNKRTPASDGPGLQGEICYDDSSVYLCTSTNTWIGLPFLGQITLESLSDPGVPGQITWDDYFLYICVATDTWQKIPFLLTNIENSQFPGEKGAMGITDLGDDTYLLVCYSTGVDDGPDNDRWGKILIDKSECLPGD